MKNVDFEMVPVSCTSSNNIAFDEVPESSSSDGLVNGKN